ncbi:MAG: putative helicase HelY [SAR116 cluster bacterium MED-G04]|nr:MAG: putative helicase HelY [SAR116 cluster bacterium MED-G04]
MPRAVLGPTNTGKTWYALERMLGHASGMFGFPLRLLARENYERAVARLGPSRVALITGEEKIIPPQASYFLCTVEAMPLDRSVDFLAVDEVQLAADPERGHVFTDRVLNARGRQETLLLGAETARRVLEAMLPGLNVTVRERLSRLSWAGQKKVTRLPRRSAVVAFSAAEVYRLAELIRSQRGGTAIVMGALSPRTRNAQVELFQSGDVDYMVATDAIGMGLNMDIEHVALAGDVKFDGRRPRRLAPAELGQIAGRAGRYTTDGTFGITDTCEMLEDEVVDAIENHRFKYLSGVVWRNAVLDYSDPDALIRSLEAPPPLSFMSRKADADDHRALSSLLERDDIRVRAHGEAEVRLLHEVCQIPDYQREYSDSHTELLARIYTHLTDGERLPKDWITGSMQRLDRPQGDIDTLMSRLSGIRTWSYITQRSHWLDGAEDFQGLARSIEDRVSDSLNQVLTERFVDRRAAVLSRRLKENSVLMSSIRPDGTVTVEGEDVGQLDGFVFTPAIAESDEKGPVLAAARKVLPDEISQRVRALVASADAAFKPDASGRIFWRDAMVGQLVKGDALYQPRAEVRSSSLLEGEQLKSVQDRLNAFALSWPREILARAVALEGETLTGTARGIAYQVFESLGTLPSRNVNEMVKQLDDDGRRQLAQHGIRLGVDMIYMPDLLKPAQIDAKALLYSLSTDERPECGPPPPGRVAIDHVDGVSDGYWLATGYRRLGGRVMRVDMAERLSATVRAAAREGEFRINEEMLSLAGATREQMEEMIVDLGYRKSGEEPAEDPEKPTISLFTRPQRPKKQRDTGGGDRPKGQGKPKGKPRQRNAGRPGEGGARSGDRPGSRKPAPKSTPIDPNSPFAVLAKLKEKS